MTKEMSFLEWAEYELKRGGYHNDELYKGKIYDAVMEILKVFDAQGHSGMSSSIVRLVFNQLVSWNPLTPITREDFDGENKQCWRAPSVFLEDDGETVEDIDVAVGMFADNGMTFSGGEIPTFKTKLPYFPSIYHKLYYSEDGKPIAWDGECWRYITWGDVYYNSRKEM